MTETVNYGHNKFYDTGPKSVCGKYFQPSLMFASKAGAYLKEAPLC